MIYTSYFGKIKSFPPNFEPICIARWRPKWYHGKDFSALAPSASLLRWWRASDKNKQCEASFSEMYTTEVLQWLNPHATARRIKQIAGDKSPVLICFEKEGFCHRHLVARWFKINGIKCEEWNGY